MSGMIQRCYGWQTHGMAWPPVSTEEYRVTNMLQCKGTIDIRNNISPEGLEKKNVFMWIPFHEWRLHCLENIPWQSDFTTMLAQGSVPPAARTLETRVVCDLIPQHSHTSLLDWSLTIRKRMIENVCLDLKNTLPKLIGVVTWKVKMQETLAADQARYLILG